MVVLKYALIVLAVIAAVAIFLASLKSKRPMKTLLSSALAGLVTLVAVAVSGHFTGVSLAINFWTLACAAASGIPGVVLMLVIKLVWRI